MKVLAVCIGVDNAGNFSKLDNAVNDAVAMQEVFESLGYETILKKDITVSEWIELSAHLQKVLKNYDSFMFFYAGHGIEVEGENYLTLKETAQDQETKSYYDRLAIRLSEVLEFEKNNLSISKIIIVDACRDNPKGVRGVQAEGFAPIATPRGTLIAFSTTSGEKAADYGFPHNSAYTGTLVHHLKSNSNIQAETLFKKVRQSVFIMTKGKKVTWEHTSLIDEFYFQKPVPKDIDYGYPAEYIKDNTYNYTDKRIAPIIAKLQSSNWYEQQDALSAFLEESAQAYTVNEKFLMGRYIIRAASNGTYKAMNILNENLVGFLSQHAEQDQQNHLLNGMLFELYFNNSGQFRFASENTEASNVLLDLRNNGLFIKSFEFLNKVLEHFATELIYYPINDTNKNIISFDLVPGEENNWNGKKKVIKEIHLNAKNITDKITATVGTSIETIDSFKQALTGLNIPLSLITLNSSIELNDLEIKQNSQDDFGF
jgi:hypothetical protein